MNKEKDFTKSYPGEWVLVKSMGESFIGRVIDDGTPFITQNVIVLSPCYEYMSSLVSDGQGGLSRNTAAIPMDLTLEECPVYLQVNFILHMSDLSEDDMEEYQRVTQRCIDVIENTKKSRRQAKSGIQIVSAIPNSTSSLIHK